MIGAAELRAQAVEEGRASLRTRSLDQNEEADQQQREVGERHQPDRARGRGLGKKGSLMRR